MHIGTEEGTTEFLSSDTETVTKELKWLPGAVQGVLSEAQCMQVELLVRYYARIDAVLEVPTTALFAAAASQEAMVLLVQAQDRYVDL